MTVVAADPIFSVLHLTNQLTSFASQNSRCYSNFDADIWVMRWKKLTLTEMVMVVAVRLSSYKIRISTS